MATFDFFSFRLSHRKPVAAGLFIAGLSFLLTACGDQPKAESQAAPAAEAQTLQDVPMNLGKDQNSKAQDSIPGMIEQIHKETDTPQK